MATTVKNTSIDECTISIKVEGVDAATRKAFLEKQFELLLEASELCVSGEERAYAIRPITEAMIELDKYLNEAYRRTE